MAGFLLGGACSSESHDIGDEGEVNTSGSTGSSAGLTTGTSGSGGSTAVSTGSNATSTGSSTTGDPLSGEACPGLPLAPGAAGAAEEVCVGVGDEVEAIGVDMYIMVDKTSSMTNTASAGGATRWQIVTQAIKDFVTESADDDLGVGLQFFGWTEAADCDPTRYATPAVGIGPASDVAGEVIAAIDAEVPIGQTPTAPALSGAVSYAKQWAGAHGDRRTVVVFVTDGYPTQCDEQDIVDIAEIASAAFTEEPQVPVYVVGIDGIYNLDQIARKGGTVTAFNVASGGTAEKLVETLGNIQSSNLSCEFYLPEPPSMLALDLERVQVVYTPPSGAAEEVPFSAIGYAGCQSSANGGWYYAGFDANGNPNKIVMCPCTCQNFRAGKVEVLVGCKPGYVLM